ncbi:unnamed protein product [Adineta steineri]|uniref:RRM domain-containing protein n=1 Tax=Adineta steineri TaxID=433720 RepID=A0A813NKB2_9BILA|nr:unnamed protein product [Adineta steineri]CAF1318196.1 unnamed protein product [Adineta steineri]CAF1583484.1 unnamed protein product [Adineta steineri]CAF4061363.1 unnamed protein product [Adineta steineri]
MSEETILIQNPVVNDETNPVATIKDEQIEESTTTTTANGLLESNGTNQTEQLQEKTEPVETTSDDKEQETYNKNDLEPEFLRKVFIGGLSYKTDDQAFKSYFSTYGDIVDCIIMRDRDGRSRGFGFVTYASSAMVDRLMAGRPHILDTREIEPKRAVPREESGKPESSLSAKKLFVGGIREGSINEHDLNEYFSKYGNIIDAVIMKTNEGKLRGFGFVEFDDYDPVDKIVLEKHHVIKGNAVNVEKALPKDQTNRARHAASNYAGGGGGGGMRGPPRTGGGWGPMGGQSNFGGGGYNGGGGYGGGGGYRSGGGGRGGGYNPGGDYGNRSSNYGGDMGGGMGGNGGGGIMGFGGPGPMGGGVGENYGMGGPPRTGYEESYGAFGTPSDFGGFGQNYGSSQGGGPMRRGGGGGRGGYNRGGGRGDGGYRGRN